VVMLPRMTRLIDLGSQTIGRLTVLGRAPGPAGCPLWECQCTCGARKVISGQALRNGHTRSCSCLRREEMSTRRTTHGATRQNRTPEYRTWASMIRRCTNPNEDNYPAYGGRGITVCDRWRGSFEAFLKDMGPRPQGTSIDRIDGSAGYEPANCRWATQKEQMRNTRRSRVLEFNGRKMPMVSWAEETGISQRLILGRLRRGWSVERALTEPVRSR
jgi:hypothetical protein